MKNKPLAKPTVRPGKSKATTAAQTLRPKARVRTVDAEVKKVAKVARSAISENIHKTAMGLLAAGVIDKQTMRKFDETCIVELPVVSPDQVRRIREKWHVSQPVLAKQMGTSASTVKKWENGANPVKGPAAIVLRLIEKNGFESLSHMLA
ncbi:MAG: helix-turn-helix domain protein [Herbaspirillum sp.]|nr:helix-turn-helix domain protein [Herbaspirillum sp.]